MGVANGHSGRPLLRNGVIVSRSLKRIAAEGHSYVLKKCCIKALGCRSRVVKKRFVRARAERKVLVSPLQAQSSSAPRVGAAAFDMTDELAGYALDLSDRFIGGEMLLFGRPVVFREEEREYPWHRDFLNDAHYAPLLYTSLHRPGHDEIKVPWEFGRMQAAVHLAMAWASTGRSCYGDELRGLLESFSRENPVGYGVQWACAMEVGIRIFNVLHAYVLVAPQLAIDDSLHILIGRLAYEHGAYLFANLETDARLYENNHYVANLLGLAAIGVILPDCDKGRKWRDYARREAERVIRKQVLSDGTGFEGSVRYARLIWEMFALIGLLYERNGLEMSNGYWQRASLLASYLSWMTPDSGESPQIGDNDSGRVLFFSTESYADLRYAACAMGGGGAVCNLPEKMVFASSPQVNQELGELRGLKLFPEGRFSVYRDDEVFLCVAATDAHRFDVPGHTHGDKLSFTLEYRNRAFFNDGGTGNYTCDSSVRDSLRSVRAHSTIQLASAEQNEFEGVFWSRRNGTSHLKASRGDHGVMIEGTHDCYQKRFGITHRRRVIYDEGFKTVRIEDILEGWNSTAPEATLRFVLDPRVEVLTLLDNRAVLRHGDAKVTLITPAALSVERGYYSREYAQLCETSVLVCPVREASLTTLIELVR